MAAITIRNLSDDVVDALKERARRNARSMEAEVRETLTRLVADDGRSSGLEQMLERRYGARRWYTTTAEIEARLAANPPTEEELRVSREWLEEHNARPYDEDPFRDPWEHAEKLREERKRAQEGA